MIRMEYLLKLVIIVRVSDVEQKDASKEKTKKLLYI